MGAAAAARARRHGAVAARARAGLRAPRAHAARALPVQLPGARRRQHGDPASRTAPTSRSKRWLEPLARGEIRSCFSMTEPELAGSNPTWLAHDGAARRRRLRHQRPQVVHLVGRRRRLRHRHGGDQSRRRSRTCAPSQIIVPTDTPGLRAACATSRSWASAGDDYARHAEVRYEDVRVPQSPTCLGARGRGLPHRAGAPRAGAHPPLHALDRHLRARLRADVRARGDARDRAGQAARHASRSCRTGSPRAAPRSTPRA